MGLCGDNGENTFAGASLHWGAPFLFCPDFGGKAMAGSKKTNFSKTSVENTAGLVATTVGVAATAITTVADIVANINQASGEATIIIPPLYDKGFSLELSQAVEMLTNCGLNAMPRKITIQEANVRYKDCFDSQVIGSNPKSKQRVPAGSTVIVNYITQEVIDKSKKIFDETEKIKAEAKLAKVKKRERQKEETQKIIVEMSDKAKLGFEKILTRRKKTGEINKDPKDVT